MASVTSHVWKFSRQSTALQVVAGHNLDGKYAIVTGANAGIGLETARALVSANCHVVLACRDMKKGGDAVNKIKSEYGNGKAEAMKLDLASFGDVKRFADEYHQKGYPLHFLILNAAVATDSHQPSVDGYETIYQTNHLSQMYLTQLLEPNLVANAPSRVIVVSSVSAQFVPQGTLTTRSLNESFFVGNARSCDGMTGYSLSKCLNVLYACELSKRLSRRGVVSFSLHPGFIDTNLFRNCETGRQVINNLTSEFRQKYEKTGEQGAATTVFCAVENDLEPFSGRYFSDCQVVDVPAWLMDDTLAKHLWTLSETLIAKKT